MRCSEGFGIILTVKGERPPTEQTSKRERNTDMAKRLNNGAAKVVRRYCETFVEEWYEFDVVKGGKVLATFTDEAKAIKFMGTAA